MRMFQTRVCCFACITSSLHVYDSKANRAADITLQAGTLHTSCFHSTSLRSQHQRAASTSDLTWGVWVTRFTKCAHGIWDIRPQNSGSFQSRDKLTISSPQLSDAPNILYRT